MSTKPPSQSGEFIERRDWSSCDEPQLHYKATYPVGCCSVWTCHLCISRLFRMQRDDSKDRRWRLKSVLFLWSWYASHYVYQVWSYLCPQVYWNLLLQLSQTLSLPRRLQSAHFGPQPGDLSQNLATYLVFSRVEYAEYNAENLALMSQTPSGWLTDRSTQLKCCCQ